MSVPVVGYVMLALNLWAFSLIWRWGGRLDRAAVLVNVAVIAVDAFSSQWTVGTWRAGSAVTNLAHFIMMLGLAERADRWWIVVTCSLSLMTLTTHLLPLMSPDHLVMTGWIVRQAIWAAITAVFFAGAWECKRRALDFSETQGTR